MKIDDLFNVAENMNEMFGEHIDDIELTLKLTPADLAEIDKELYKISGASNGFRHTKIVQAQINGVSFRLLEKEL